jgi:N-dimethylarginine dimethylaminohydrolase
MTSPASFAVQYDINVHMTGNEGKVDVPLAMKQWSNVRNALLQVGADVIVMPASPPNCPDAVFTANAGLILGNQFIPSYFRNIERSPEEPYFIDWFRAHGFSIDMMPKRPRDVSAFEGAGDALFSEKRKTLWLGHGFRSTEAGQLVVRTKMLDLGADGYLLKLVDPRWYHLDTCFCPLDDGTLLWYPEAFDAASRGLIERHFSKMVMVSENDAVRFACNAVSVDKSIVMPLVSDELSSTLSELGFTVHQVDMSEFLKSGGACKCLTLEVNGVNS